MKQEVRDNYGEAIRPAPHNGVVSVQGSKERDKLETRKYKINRT